MELDFGLVWQSRDLLLQASALSVAIAVGAFLLACAGGLLLATARSGEWVPGRWTAFVVLNVLRGCALYVLLVWLFNGLAVAAGILLSAITVGVLALALINAAYLAEVFRSGIDAVDPGQREAAEALGLSGLDTFRLVLLPQWVRVVVPAAGNHLIDAVKDSAVLAVIAVPELMFQTNRMAQSTFRPFEFYLAAAAIYLVIVNVLAALLRVIERRIDAPPRPLGGLAAAGPARTPADPVSTATTGA